jgi:flagellar basal-body rod protein FlgC
MGVHVAAIEVDQSPLTPRWDPGNPFAHRSGPYAGYVMEPQVNTVVEQINALEATRAYEANATVAEATKQMVSQVLRLLA